MKLGCFKRTLRKKPPFILQKSKKSVALARSLVMTARKAAGFGPAESLAVHALKLCWDGHYCIKNGEFYHRIL